jgi:hypothetical protein
LNDLEKGRDICTGTTLIGCISFRYGGKLVKFGLAVGNRVGILKNEKNKRAYNFS